MADPEEEPKWQQEAKCLGMDPTFFYPVVIDQRTGLPLKLKSGADKPDLGGVQRAKEFCWGGRSDGDCVCPVRQECLHWAIIHEEWDGVHGGMVDREKRRYARRKRSGIGFGGGIEAPT